MSDTAKFVLRRMAKDGWVLRTMLFSPTFTDGGHTVLEPQAGWAIRHSHGWKGISPAIRFGLRDRGYIEEASRVQRVTSYGAEVIDVVYQLTAKGAEAAAAVCEAQP